MAEIKRETIIIPIYFYEDKGKKVLDLQSMADEFEEAIQDIQKNPDKYLK